MVTFFWCVLGALIAGYFALAGNDYGTAILLRTLTRDEPERRRALGAIGPFFLANQVWLVAAVGVLFGAFPHLEGKLFAGAYLVVVLLLTGLVMVTAAVQLRSRRPDGERRAWDGLIVTGAVLTTGSWGLFVGNLVRGLPVEGRTVTELFDLHSVVWAAGFVALFSLQGAVFLAARGSDEIAARARRLARVLLPPVVSFVLVVTAWTALDQGAAIENPAAGIGTAALALVALLVTWLALAAHRPRTALLGCMVLATTPALAVGLLRYPRVLISTEHPGGGLTVAQSASAPETLDVLMVVTPPVLVLVAAVQGWTWLANRRRVGAASVLHF
ncbi:cytochrome d ubiquinol oxidase subunit II [Amycolatopsis minnesotensis]|uniref:Cytochrome d ubiquinol oxidase subunit II n=1 Tax=Amycolatopsis minnesotensis TaxID=337894 RepID=A0ABP5E0E5_9PSEU